MDFTLDPALTAYLAELDRFVAAGDTVQADFGRLGNVAVQFV